MKAKSNHPPSATGTPKPASQTRLIPVPDWANHHPWPPVGGMRHLIFHAKTNGFEAVIRRIGRRVLIDEEAFYQWVAETGSPNLSH